MGWFEGPSYVAHIPGVTHGTTRVVLKHNKLW